MFQYSPILGRSSIWDLKLTFPPYFLQCFWPFCFFLFWLLCCYYSLFFFIFFFLTTKSKKKGQNLGSTQGYAAKVSPHTNACRCVSHTFCFLALLYNYIFQPMGRYNFHWVNTFYTATYPIWQIIFQLWTESLPRFQLYRCNTLYLSFPRSWLSTLTPVVLSYIETLVATIALSDLSVVFIPRVSWFWYARYATS